MIFFLRYLLVVCFSIGTIQAASVEIKPGEEVKIKANKESTVKCEAETVSSTTSSEAVVPLCHKMHGDSSCNGLPVGTVCRGGTDKKHCISDGMFAGAFNCRCK